MNFCKYADDTYLIVPASNVDTRTAELRNITDWATINNLSLNLSKSEEIVFIDKRRESHFQTPEMLNGQEHIQHIKIFVVTFTNGLSVTLHIQQLIAFNAQALYALKLLRAHGLCDKAIQTVFHSVVLARYLYASPAWWGFAGVQDRQKVEGFLCCSTPAGFCCKDLPGT